MKYEGFTMQTRVTATDQGNNFHSESRHETIDFPRPRTSGETLHILSLIFDRVPARIDETHLVYGPYPHAEISGLELTYYVTLNEEEAQQ